MKNKYFAGIDVGGTKISGALATSQGKILCRVKSPTPKDASPERIIGIIADLVNEMIGIRDLRKKDLAGIGLGIPGIVDSARGKVIRTPNMRLSGINLKDKLEKKLKIKCLLGNDVNLGLLAEKWLGAAKNTKNVAGLFIGTGVGGGIIINDQLLTGAHGAAAELGHMIIQDDGPGCGCGNNGCLEAVAGRLAIERDIYQAIKKGKKTLITKFLHKKTGAIKSKVLRKALKKRDKLTIDVLSKAAQQLGIACVCLRHILDPEMIVLGGGVIEACGDFILPIVKKTVQKDRFFSFIKDCRIVASKLGDDATILGAIALSKNLALNRNS